MSRDSIEWNRCQPYKFTQNPHSSWQKNTIQSSVTTNSTAKLQFCSTKSIERIDDTGKLTKTKKSNYFYSEWLQLKALNIQRFFGLYSVVKETSKYTTEEQQKKNEKTFALHWNAFHVTICQNAFPQKNKRDRERKKSALYANERRLSAKSGQSRTNNDECVYANQIATKIHSPVHSLSFGCFVGWMFAFWHWTYKMLIAILLRVLQTKCIYSNATSNFCSALFFIFIFMS